MTKEQKQELNNQISAIQSKLGLLRNEIMRNRLPDGLVVSMYLNESEDLADKMLLQTEKKGGLAS